MEYYAAEDIRTIVEIPKGTVSMEFKFYARGHPAVSSTHPTTLEITTETHLGESGDCIVAIGSSARLRDLPAIAKAALRSRDCKAYLTLRLDSELFTVEGQGSPGLTFSHPTDIVVRRSGYISDRTLMVHANRSAADIPRRLVRLLQDPNQRVLVELVIEP